MFNVRIGRSPNTYASSMEQSTLCPVGSKIVAEKKKRHRVIFVRYDMPLPKPAGLIDIVTVERMFTDNLATCSQKTLEEFNGVQCDKILFGMSYPLQESNVFSHRLYMMDNTYLDRWRIPLHSLRAASCFCITIPHTVHTDHCITIITFAHTIKALQCLRILEWVSHSLSHPEQVFAQSSQKFWSH